MIIAPQEYNITPEWLGKIWWIFIRYWPLDTKVSLDPMGRGLITYHLDAYTLDFYPPGNEQRQECVDLMGKLVFKDNCGQFSGRLGVLPDGVSLDQVLWCHQPLVQVTKSMPKEGNRDIIGVAEGSEHLSLDLVVRNSVSPMCSHFQVERRDVLESAFARPIIHIPLEPDLEWNGFSVSTGFALDSSKSQLGQALIVLRKLIPKDRG